MVMGAFYYLSGMRFFLTFFCLLVFSANAQGVGGWWYGSIDVMGMEMRLNLKITNTDSEPEAILVSPDQSEAEMKAEIEINKDSIFVEIKSLMLSIKGNYNNEEEIIDAEFRQSVISSELKFQREPLEKQEIKRPQTPVGPYSYFSKDVVIKNEKSGYDLGATLTLPKEIRKYPVVILASGSGAQDRDETIMEHKPFAVIADHLAKNGIGCLRFDDRGVGKSGGSFGKANLMDFASDVEAVFRYAKTRPEVSKIGLCGHSEGGMHIMIANKSIKKKADFMIFLACVGTDGTDVILTQQREMAPTEEEGIENAEFMAKVIDIVKSKNEPSADLSKFLDSAYLQLSPEDKNEAGTQLQFKMGIMSFVNNEWFKQFVMFNSSDYYKGLKKTPTLVLNGEKDVQVNSKKNLKAFETGLKKVKAKDFTIIEMKGMNHLFQKCESCTISEYGKIETTIEQQVLDEMSTWLHQILKD